MSDILILLAILVGVPLFVGFVTVNPRNWRWYRRLRGGRWSHVFHAPSMCSFWARDWKKLGSEVEEYAEDYRGPRARVLP